MFQCSTREKLIIISDDSVCKVRSSLCAAEVSGCSGSPVFSSVCQNLSLRRPQIQRDTAMSHIPAGSAPSPHPPPATTASLWLLLTPSHMQRPAARRAEQSAIVFLQHGGRFPFRRRICDLQIYVPAWNGWA